MPISSQSSRVFGLGAFDAYSGAARQVGFSNEGKIQALDLRLYTNSGNSLDLTPSIMDRALAHTDNSYVIPHVRAVGTCCVTHQASNTAYRGFGGPQVSTQLARGSSGFERLSRPESCLV